MKKERKGCGHGEGREGHGGWQEVCTEKVTLSQGSKEVRWLLVQISKGGTLQAEATGTTKALS